MNMPAVDFVYAAHNVLTTHNNTNYDDRYSAFSSLYASRLLGFSMYALLLPIGLEY